MKREAHSSCASSAAGSGVHCGTSRPGRFFTAAFAAASAYEIEEKPILDNPDRRVLWRPADAVSPPLYPAGLTELIASQLT